METVVKRSHSEALLSKKIVAQLRKDLPEYSVDPGINLLYKLFIGPDGKTWPQGSGKVSRGFQKYGFQTDILISNKKMGLPLVVVELKNKGFSTHDVLIYSSKALKHKEIYPYLRYGFIVGQKKIDRKFFVHNVGFDFAMTVGSYRTTAQKGELADLIRRQARIAEKLGELVEGKGPLNHIYETSVEME